MGSSSFICAKMFFLVHRRKESNMSAHAFYNCVFKCKLCIYDILRRKHKIQQWWTILLCRKIYFYVRLTWEPNGNLIFYDYCLWWCRPAAGYTSWKTISTLYFQRINSEIRHSKTNHTNDKLNLWKVNWIFFQISEHFSF